MVLSIGAGIVGWGMAWHFYRHADKGYTEPLAVTVPPLYTTLYHKWYVDELYDHLFTGRRKTGNVRLGVMGLGDASTWLDVHVVDGAVNGTGWSTRLVASISKWFDTWIIDGIGVNGPAILARMLSYPFRLFEWGLVQWYALVMIAGLLGFVFYYAYR
jgi:NADH-quinone oxidoreductase subunit L